MITCEHIALSFNGKPVFEDLSVQVPAGSHVCIGGASGRGKTTFLNLLQGYILPDAGLVAIGDMPVNPAIKQLIHVTRQLQDQGKTIVSASHNSLWLHAAETRIDL